MSGISEDQKKHWFWENLFQILIAALATTCTLILGDMRTEVKTLSDELKKSNVAIQKLVVGISENGAEIRFNRERIQRLENIMDNK